MSFKQLNNRLFNAHTLWLISMVVFIAYRLTALLCFGLNFTDSDQVVIWHSAKDFAAGIFREPCYYGQAYNSNLEGFLAVPLVWAGIKPYIAVPLVSSIMAAFPFLLFSVSAKKEQKPVLASLVLWLTFLLPDSFTELSIMSRGFIQGIFCAVCGWYLFHKKTSSLRIASGIFLLSMGIFQNVNALMFVVPLFAVILFEKKWWNLKTLLSCLSGFVIAYGLKLLAERFYLLHPAKNTHYIPSFSGDMGYFKDHLGNLDVFLAQTFPRIPSPFAGFVLFLLVVLLLHRFGKQSLLFSLILLILFMGSLFLAKLDNYSTSVFFGQGRFFLAMPYALLFMVVTAPELPLPSIALRYLIPFSLLIGLLFCGEFKHNVDHDQSLRNDYTLAIQTIPELKKHCAALNDSLHKEKIGFVLVGNHWAYNLASMGCACIEDSFPFAIRAQHERRTWLFDSAQNKYPGKLLLMHTDTLPQRVLDSSYKNRKTHIWGQSWIVQTDTTRIRDFIKFYTNRLLKH